MDDIDTRLREITWECRLHDISINQAIAQLKTLIAEQVIAELELIMLRRESGGRTGIRNRVRDRINQLKDKQGE